MSVDHYENFPVASVLCPPTIRPAVVAIYHFARTADDIADEGAAPPAERHAALAAYRADLQAVERGAAPSARWAPVFAPLAAAMERYALPPIWLHRLLDAFVQDVDNPAYADRAQILRYCSRSADPVGRLLLHLYGVHDAESERRADAICTGLQLANFWQDLGLDASRGRVYLPHDELAAAGITLDEVLARQDTPALRRLVHELCAWAESLLRDGAPLALDVPGRAGWELRLVVQGGLRVLERIARMNHATISARPTLGATDLPALLWRAATMRRPR
ncbi:squalene synthase HpnC [Rubrivivax gelatinosus]|uniref:Squalene/phytoene synthase n=1 Tax=Rubrivivax gelatinosus (strain NBRC 100245 / IL144) TaxID=983917 RepID=I0HT00_RUBGI|nr:squalene synthase HpnC [Rubrivivax gelatinosus]MBG6082665.1 squalene synthase HpnC [Rubrivivax gelatinosus]BAL96137.1 squalene/phytoene synthase [Rubrivivax gelatinosus IL144]